MSDDLANRYDVVVIGGGAAGLNGALMLARSRRSVVVIDSGAPRNAPADGVHGLLGHDGVPPATLLERGRAEVRHYGGQIARGEVVGASSLDDEFAVTLADGRAVTARRLLVTTGLVDELPDIAGLRERWGRDVLHCPYCHGWEVRDMPIGVLANNPKSVHQAMLFRQLTDDVTYFAHTMPPTEQEREELAARNIRLIHGTVTALEISDDRLTGVRLADDSVVARAVLAVAPRMVGRAGFLGDLGLRAVPHPAGIGEHILVDAAGHTEVVGVWAAGNVTDLSAQVGASAAAGALAGAQINADLVAEEIRDAVTAHRSANPTPKVATV
jgi:thioredoxin reductase